MAKGRKKRAELTEYEKAVADYRKTSARHVLVLEADLTEDEKRRIFYDADLVRQCGNTLVGIMKRNYEQLARTKRYRRLKELYGTLSETVKKMESLESPTRDQKTLLKQKHFELKSCAASMSEMQEFYHVTWEFCRKQMESIKESYGVPSVFALTRAEDIWRSVEKILYSDGKQLHFRKRGDLPEIRAKQASRAIVIKSSDSGLVFKYRDLNIHCKIKPGDTWALAEQDAILAYLKNPDLCDAYAVSSMDKGMIDTFRPCYASLVCKEIRGKLRVYVHLTIEGNPIQKTKNGHARHQYGKGNVGTDIGTQTVAYTSTNKVGLENLAERGNTIEHSERMERRILRAMDRSRRATNPENYNPDGTIKKGKKVWIKSNRYRKLQKRHQELCRINAQNRKLACQELANQLRSLGNVLITEPKNAKKLQKRANPEDSLDKNGKLKRKKRFGKSIRNRCPGYFQECLKKKFESTGGVYIEVPVDYRASQYDHTADDYIKKTLSQRMYRLADGTLVQRDWYSSFLLYCINEEHTGIDKRKCLEFFKYLYQLEQERVDSIARSGKKIMNSGIRTKGMAA